MIGIGDLMSSMKDCFHSETEKKTSNEKPKDKSLNPEVQLEYKYFNQKRDHFHHSDSNRWRQVSESIVLKIIEKISTCIIHLCVSCFLFDLLRGT